MNVVTRPSLLAKLSQPSDASAWELFYSQYAKLILGFAIDRGIDQEGARDVLQETMIVVMRKVPTFEYDPGRGRFSNWLLTIVDHKIREARRRKRAELYLSLDEAKEKNETGIDEVAAEDAQAEASLERAWRSKLLEEAIRLVLSDPHTRPESVAVFRACALDGEAPAEVALRFKLKPNAVYQIKNRLDRGSAAVHGSDQGMRSASHFFSIWLRFLQVAGG